MVRLSEFGLDIQHRKGRKSANVDGITRTEPPQNDTYGKTDIECLYDTHSEKEKVVGVVTRKKRKQEEMEKEREKEKGKEKERESEKEKVKEKVKMREEEGEREKEREKERKGKKGAMERREGIEEEKKESESVIEMGDTCDINMESDKKEEEKTEKDILKEWGIR